MNKQLNSLVFVKPERRFGWLLDDIEYVSEIAIGMRPATPADKDLVKWRHIELGGMKDYQPVDDLVITDHNAQCTWGEADDVMLKVTEVVREDNNLSTRNVFIDLKSFQAIKLGIQLIEAGYAAMELDALYTEQMIKDRL